MRDINLKPVIEYIKDHTVRIMIQRFGPNRTALSTNLHNYAANKLNRDVGPRIIMLINSMRAVLLDV